MASPEVCEGKDEADKEGEGKRCGHILIFSSALTYGRYDTLIPLLKGHSDVIGKVDYIHDYLSDIVHLELHSAFLKLMPETHAGVQVIIY